MKSFVFLRSSNTREIFTGKMFVLCASIIMICLFCSPPKKAAPKENAPVTKESKEDNTSGYLSMSDWDKAKLCISVFEELNKNEMDTFFNASGLAIQYQEFGQYEQAVDASRKIPATIDALETAIPKFESVPSYPEIDQMKNNLSKMIPHMRKYAENLTKSLEASKAGNQAVANEIKNIYTADHRKAMAFYRNAFDNFRELLTHGGRTESQKLTGAKTGGPAVVGDFKKIVQGITDKYAMILSADVPAIDNFTENKNYDKAIEQSDKVYSSVQGLIMEMNSLNPGNEKALWDAKTALLTVLSYRMFTAQKHKEYLMKMKSGDPTNTEEIKKHLDLYKKLADEEWVKYRKLKF